MSTLTALGPLTIAAPIVATLGTGTESAYKEIARFAPSMAGVILMQFDVAGNALGGLKFMRNAAPGGADVTLVADGNIEASPFVVETVNDGTHPVYQTAAGSSSQVLAVFRGGAEFSVLAKRADNSAIATVTLTASMGDIRLSPVPVAGQLGATVPGPLTVGGLATLSGGAALADAQNLAFGTTTGTKIGASATQKIGFFGASPVAQPASASANSATGAAGSTTNVFTNTTFTGGTGATAYSVGDVVKNLKALGLLAA
ncbi:MAG: hypothetical protein JWO57_660 [Pseudonocardiales bacterium]|nr:hypothetical protein [Pseudonocardiales bacterium]